MKTKIAKLLEIKKPRYITKEYLHDTDEELLKSIMEATSFLDPSETMSHRLFCVMHDIHESHKCPNCRTETKALFRSYETPIEDYRYSFCSVACMRTYYGRIIEIPIDIELPYADEGSIVEKARACIDGRIMLKMTIAELNTLKQMVESRGISRNGMSRVEACHIIARDLREKPKCRCGQIIKYDEQDRDYRKYCSAKCNMTSAITTEKRITTCNEKYGVDHIMQSEDVKNKMRNNAEERYGYGITSASQLESVKEKVRQTWREKSREEMDALRQKRDKTIMEKYGVSNSFNTTAGEKSRLLVSKARVVKSMEKFEHLVRPLFDMNDWDGIGKSYRWLCLKCNQEFDHVYRHTRKNGSLPHCPLCSSVVSSGHREIHEFLTHIGVNNILMNDRTIIQPLELDMVIPSHNLAIEFDGLYWHSYKNGTRPIAHKYKTELCNKAGLRLVHVFEDEWNLKRNIVKSRLRNILAKGICNIGARKCEIRSISAALKNKFLKKYHIQGECRSTSIFLGLFYKSRLLSVMTFGKMRHITGRRNVKDSYELIRFASMNNVNVSGGADRMFKHFLNNFNPNMVLSYADRRWSEGNLYKKLGFVLKNASAPCQWYMKDYTKRMHRSGFMRHTLVSDPEDKRSEWEIMKSRGFDKIYDCGTLVFEWHRPKTEQTEIEYSI